MTSQWQMARTGDRWVVKSSQPKAKDGFYWTDGVYWKVSRVPDEPKGLAYGRARSRMGCSMMNGLVNGLAWMTRNHLEAYSTPPPSMP